MPGNDLTITFPEDFNSRQIVFAQLTNSICTLISAGYRPTQAGTIALVLYRTFQLEDGNAKHAIHAFLAELENRGEFPQSQKED